MAVHGVLRLTIASLGQVSYRLGLVGGGVVRFLAWPISAALGPKALAVARFLRPSGSGIDHGKRSAGLPTGKSCEDSGSSRRWDKYRFCAIIFHFISS